MIAFALILLAGAPAAAIQQDPSDVQCANEVIPPWWNEADNGPWPCEATGYHPPGTLPPWAVPTNRSDRTSAPAVEDSDTPTEK